MLAIWAALVAATVFLAGCSDKAPRFAPLPAHSTVLVIGDSLVAGTGAASGEAWPEALGRLTGWQVVNAGVPGNTSADALARLDGLLQRHAPGAVIIAVGGNDFLRQVPLEATRDNLVRMVAASRAVTPHVAIMAVPELSMTRAAVGRLADHELFARIADEHAIALIPGAISTTLSRAELRADRIHANAAGYAEIARLSVEALRRQGWLAD